MITQCAYCQSEGNWAYTLYLQNHEKSQREDKNLIPLEEPMYLCDYCHNCAFRITSSLIYNHEQQPATVADLEQTLARYLNYAASRS